MVPLEEGRRSEPTRLDISVEGPEYIVDKIRRIAILVLQNWMEKHMIGVRELLIVLEVHVKAALRSLAQI